MKSFILIDHIADYSLVKSFYKYDILDPYMLILSSALKLSQCQVQFIDGREPDFTISNLYAIIKNEQPDFIILKADEQNIKNIERLNLHLFDINIHIITTQENLLIPSMYTKIFLDESIGIQENVEKTINTFDINFEINKLKYTETFWNFADKLLGLKYKPLINIGSGCDRGCNFCTISNTQVKLKNIKLIVDEIDYLLTKKGVSAFHIKNHNVCNKLAFLEDLSEEILERQFGINFSWSCYLSPESLETIDNRKYFLNNIAKANLKQVFLGVEHVNDEILRYYNIDYDKSQLITNINEMFSAGIQSVVINFIIGSKYESSESMTELINFSKLILAEVHGAVEFNVSFYTNKYHVNYMEKNISDRDSLFLTRYQIMNYKKEFFALTLSQMQQNLTKWSTKEKYEHLQINDHGIITQFFFYTISRTAFYNLYASTKQNNIRYSFQIDDNAILSYTPYTHVIVECDEKHEFISVDPRLSSNRESKMYLNDVDLFLIDIAKRFLPLSNIARHLSEKGFDYQESVRITLNFYNTLESLGLLVYFKSL